MTDPSINSGFNNCVFCKIVTGDIPSHKVYEDADTLAFLDIHPVNAGHTLVIPKAHFENFAQTPKETAATLLHLSQRLAPGILKAVGADAFNLSTNNGRAAGQLVFHTHFHLIPRFPADGHKMWQGSDEHQDFAAMALKIKECVGRSA
ncbi:HIT family protein [Patescibacteria group bacterium]|nr:MAG: HIT family protein [Patescibacteria group bacterium]